MDILKYGAYSWIIVSLLCTIAVWIWAIWDDQEKKRILKRQTDKIIRDVLITRGKS